MLLRFSKILLIWAIALFATLVAFGNITDYQTNFAFVHHVFLMDTLPPDSSILWRSIHKVWLHHVGYIFIIALETCTAILCWIGGFRLLCNRHQPAAVFNRQKNIAIAGLTLGFLTWHVAFMSVGGEWFGMWMSKWNGVPDAFRFFITILMVLIYLIQKDSDPE